MQIEKLAEKLNDKTHYQVWVQTDVKLNRLQRRMEKQLNWQARKIMQNRLWTIDNVRRLGSYQLMNSWL